MTDFHRCTDSAAKRDTLTLVNTLQNTPTCQIARLRWLSQKGDAILVIGISDPGSKPRIGFEESARTSRIRDDLETLLSLSSKLGNAGIAGASEALVVTEAHVLTKTRATLTVSLSVANAAKAADTDDASNAVKTSIITGPAEHLFLSADVGVTNAKQLSYDKDSKSFGPAETPKQFYISANISASDLNADPADQPFVRMLQSVYAGFLVEGSTRPFQQIGAVLGIRYLPVLGDIVGVDKLSPYGGVLWVKDETLTGVSAVSPGTVKTRYGSPKAVFGASFNLTEALGWVGGDSKKK